MSNKNAFQWDAYRPLVDHIPECTAWGCTCQGVVPAQGGVPAQGVYLPGGVSQHAMGQTSPRGQTDTCENTAYANLVCGRYFLNHAFRSLIVIPSKVRPQKGNDSIMVVELK